MKVFEYKAAEKKSIALIKGFRGTHATEMSDDPKYNFDSIICADFPPSLVLSLKDNILIVTENSEGVVLSKDLEWENTEEGIHIYVRTGGTVSVTIE